MSQQAHESRAVLDAVSIEQWRTERPRLKQAEGRPRSSRKRTDRAHPLEFDEGGFPVAQRNASFVERVARLRDPL
jgi:hypothetical protein